MSFINDIDNFQDIIGSDVEKFTRRAALGVFDKVVKKSPVDTGRFRASWTYNEDNIDGTISNGSRGQQPPTPPIGKLSKPYTVVKIANSLPYGVDLNAGSSRQAPALFVESSVIEEERELNR